MDCRFIQVVEGHDEGLDLDGGGLKATGHRGGVIIN